MKGAYLSIIMALPKGNKGEGEAVRGPLLKAEQDHFQCTVMVSIDPDSVITTGNTGLKVE